MVIGSWFNLTALKLIGIQEDFIFYILISTGIIASFLLMKPIIVWLINLRSVFLINYIISSLTIFVLLFVIVFFLIETGHSINYLLKITLQCMAVFGVIMVLYYSFQKIIRKN